MKSKSEGPFSLHLRLRIVGSDKVALGPGKIELLALIEETGSIREAARRMNMSYMRAWSLIQTMNASFKQPVIQTARGGNARGGATITATGRQLLAIYRQMETAGIRAVRKDWRTLRKLLRA